MRLRQFNRLPRSDAEEVLRSCLPVARWVTTVAAARPFRRLGDLFATATRAASPLTPAELEAALARHPPAPLPPPQTRRPKAPAELRVRDQLTAAMEHYQQRFGRPFLSASTAVPPAQILVELWERLGHDPDAEDKVIAAQLHQLALFRLAELVTA